MKFWTILTAFLCWSLTAHATLSLEEIRTASKDVLVAFFKSDTVILDEVNVGDLSLWKLNGQPVKAIHRFVTESNACDHYIYLQVPELVNGKAYTLETPHGNSAFTFDDKTIFCESIKTNQSGYSALSKVRYANFAIWLGDGGSKKIEGALPAYTVYDEFTGKPITSGTLKEIGQDASSGDFVYRINLSAVPEGGPYVISVKGYGCSYPFGVGADFSRRLGHVSFRSLYHQRCGVQIMWPYAWNIRMKPCHEVIYKTYGPIAEARLKVTGTEPSFKAWGGYHDAGDADRRTYHMDVTCALLTTYEAFPEYFTDDQFNIPDRFDENFNILGKCNGIPDIIDEAAWGAMFWEYVQEESGEMIWGTETTGYSPFTTYDREDHLFGSEKLDSRTAAWASGMFMHLARIIQPYKPEKAKELMERAERAFKAAGETITPNHKMYFSVEKYLLTGDATAHQYIKDHAQDVMELANTYNARTEDFAQKAWMASYFYSYVIAKKRPTDPAVVNIFKNALKTTADKQLEYLALNAYPVGAPSTLRWWGSNVAQGQFSHSVLLYWRISKEQKYIDAVSQMMDYAMGLNPLGKSFMTGMGFNRVYNPHDRESAYTIEQGWGPRPGILIFGPGLATRNGVTYPAFTKETPRERIYIDNRGAISQSEFTIYQSLCFPAAIYPVLAKGGKYDESKNPFVNQK
ncbi:MAG: glycoside hydrolase family 9 protein [Bacteroidales bacterium]|nr:glycoside hydrolase family 9 protein [Bacteroidales bacterium]